MDNTALKCEFCGCPGTFVHENVGIVFGCEGVLSQPTICDLKRQRSLYQMKTNSAMNQMQEARDCDKAYFSWLINDHKTMIKNINKIIDNRGVE
jgi:hypothetical protein